MKPFIKLLVLAFLLAVILIIPFALWGSWFGRLLDPGSAAKWFSQVRSVAWLIAIGLLVSDLILPIPATGVMAALGAVYGPAIGTLIAVAGSTLSALVGYSLARWPGRRAVRLIASDTDLQRFRAFFDRWGGTAIIVSRILPILPEVTSVLAGLAPMTFRRFLAAVLFGTIPTCALFACIGAASASQPWYGIILAVLIPLILWPLFLRLTRTSRPR